MIESSRYEEVLQIRLCRSPEFRLTATVSAYLVDGLLIDSGPAHTAKELVGFLKDQTVKAVVSTHHHEDHIAANAFLQDRFGAEVLAHELAVDKIARPAELYPYQVEAWGDPVPSRARPLGPNIATKNHVFEVIHTPGHDRDHVCLFERARGWLFSGDLFVSTRPVICRPMEDFWQVVEDLKLVRGLSPRLIFPAPTRVIEDPRERLERVIATLEELGGKIMQLHEEGLLPAEIRQRIFGEENQASARTQQQFSSGNLVKSFLKRSDLAARSG